MATYLLAHGSHTIGPKKSGDQPQKFKQGALIESDVDLVKKHGEKFAYPNRPTAESAESAPASPTIIKSEDEGRYDVLGSDGVRVNDKSLTKKQAVMAVAELIADGIDDDDEDQDSDSDEGNE